MCVVDLPVYKKPNGNIYTYCPDFIINGNEIIEIKPKALQNIKINMIKFKAGEEYAKKHNMKFSVLEPIQISFEEIKKMVDNGLIIFVKRIQEKYQKIIRITH